MRKLLATITLVLTTFSVARPQDASFCNAFQRLLDACANLGIKTTGQSCKDGSYLLALQLLSKGIKEDAVSEIVKVCYVVCVRPDVYLLNRDKVYDFCVYGQR